MRPQRDSAKSECVKVVVRCRPLNKTEITRGHVQVVQMYPDRGSCEVQNPKVLPSDPSKSFTFDGVYGPDSKQTDLYDETFRELVQAVLDGFNGTIFAYGQTGTGKTYTMQGENSDPGVIPHSFEHIFSHIARTENQQFLVRASYLEIYMEEIQDLLNKDLSKRLELHERPDKGIYVKDLTSFVTKNVKEIQQVMNLGNKHRAVAPTEMNDKSSRSHAIFMITIESSEVGPDGKNHIKVGKLNLVDLAGSERQDKTHSVGHRLKEAIKINLSLSALGHCIKALVDSKSSHIPYRDSALTKILKDSLGGNAKTVMIANIGPASWNYDETITTLRYADSAKRIKNKPKINEDQKDALLRQFQEEIQRLKQALDSKSRPRGPQNRRRRRGPDGEIISDDEEEEDSGAVAESYMQDLKQKLQEEEEAIFNDKNLISEEKENLLAQCIERQNRLEKERDTQKALASKIREMESKLLCGGKNIIDHTNDQQKALEIRSHEITEEKRQEREIQQKLAEEEENALGIQEKHLPLQEQADLKTRQIKKLFKKLQVAKQEIEDLTDEHTAERQELDQTYGELIREVKLRKLIIDNFIIPEDKARFITRAKFDEKEETWTLIPSSSDEAVMMERPASAFGDQRPMTEFARVAAAETGRMRYKWENILYLNLDMSLRTTRDYEGPEVAPKLQAALDTALQEEEYLDVDLDGRSKSPDIFKSTSKPKRSDKTRWPSEPKKSPSKFPVSRGLVPK